MNTSNTLNVSAMFASVLGGSTLEQFESNNKEEKPKEENEPKAEPVPEEKHPVIAPENKKQYVNTTRISDISSVDQNTQKTTYDFRVILLGNIAVGKTCIISRFVHNKYDRDYKCSIGVEFNTKTLNISQSSIANLKIWDTCGDEKYRAITRQYYKDAEGILLVYDITNKKTFEGLNDWYQDIKDKCIKNVQIILVGNKSDLAEKDKVVTNEDIQGFLKDKKNIDSIEVSAKTGRNITLLFETLTNRLIMTQKERQKDNEDNNKSSCSTKLSASPKKRMNLNVGSKKDENKLGCC